MVRATWFWENDIGKQVPFFETSCDALESAYVAGNWGVKVKITDGKVVVMEGEDNYFQLEIQTNTIRTVTRGFLEEDGVPKNNETPPVPFVPTVAKKEENVKSSSGSVSGGSESSVCCVCLTNPKDCVLKPCSHVCVCSECAKQLVKLRGGCPICRERIVRVEKVYIT